MTEHKSFKRLVRARMAKTAESYTAARAMLLRGDAPKGSNTVRLATSDDRIRQRTGHGWEEWFAMLDDWAAHDRSHREIARWVAARLGIAPLAWNAQAITASYELTRGLRVPGEKHDGFAITVSRTVAAPVERLYDAFVEGSRRSRWLPDGELSQRTATRATSARFDWLTGESRVNVTFLDKHPHGSTIALQHRRLRDADEAARMKAYWRERLHSLKRLLERGEIDA